MFSPDICDPNHPQHEATRNSLVSKLDWHVLPGLSLLWLACFIDRTNVGNAKVAGMETSLGLRGNQFNVALAVFYITYIASELPSNYMLRIVGGKIWLPFLVAGWGIVTIFSGFMKNYASLLVVRLLLGLFEGGLLPGMVFYLSTMYKRDELQLRVGIFFAFASLSGAFGGLLAYGIDHMDGIDGKRGWQWIFFLEGIATVLVAVFAVYYLPSSLETASFLSTQEKDFAVRRLKYAPQVSVGPMSSKTTSGSQIASSKAPLDREKSSKFTSGNQELCSASEDNEGSIHSEVEEFETYEVIRALKEPQVWLTGIGYMSICVGMYSYSLFLPSIVAGMGQHAAKAQLFSSFPYIPATVLVVIIAFLADRIQLRGPLVMMLLPLTMTGYVLAILAKANAVRYAGVFLMAAGIYPSIPCILCILQNNKSGLTKRNAAAALQLMITNCAGFIATFIYTSDQAPRYRRGHSISLAFTCLAWLMVGCNTAYCAWENKARATGLRASNIDKYQALLRDGKTTAPIGDRAPDFKFTL